MPIFLKKFLFNLSQQLWRKWYPRHAEFELESKHIAKLKVVANRSDFLKLLPKGGVVAELGVEYGLFSKQINEIVKPEKLMLVDIWGNAAVLRQCKENLQSFQNVEYVQTDSLQFLHSCKAKSLDWVYIDTDHSYELTYKELLASEHAVKDQGFICGHDYTQIASAGIRQYGVVPAVNRFCLERGYEMVFLTHESSRHLSFGLRKMP